MPQILEANSAFIAIVYRYRFVYRLVVYRAQLQGTGNRSEVLYE